MPSRPRSLPPTATGQRPSPPGGGGSAGLARGNPHYHRNHITRHVCHTRTCAETEAHRDTVYMMTHSTRAHAHTRTEADGTSQSHFPRLRLCHFLYSPHPPRSHSHPFFSGKNTPARTHTHTHTQIKEREWPISPCSVLLH